MRFLIGIDDTDNLESRGTGHRARQLAQQLEAQALAAELADTVTFAVMPGDARAETMRLAADSRALRDLELAHHVAVVGDAVSPFMAPPDTDPAALRAADSLLVLPSDPKAATEEILRRREEGGFTYFVVGANAADEFAPVVAELTDTEPHKA